MLTCKYCAHLKKCIADANKRGCEHNPNYEGEGGCPYYGFKRNTNADRIRAMSDDELAVWIRNGVSSDHCDYCEYNNGYCDGSPCRGKSDAQIIIDWLKQPAKDGEDE